MQQIRFDFLTGLSGGNNRSAANTNAAEPSGDAFARILDQQLTRRGDDAVKSRAAEPRSRGDAGERAEQPRSQAAKRRDAKSVAATEKPEAKAAPKTKLPEKTTGENARCAKPADQPETDAAEPTAEAAAPAQPAGESSASTGTAESDSQADSSGDQGQQPANDGSQQPPQGDGGEQPETLPAGIDPSLLALLAVPLPIQTTGAELDTSGEATALVDDGSAATALQAALAAQLGGAIDFSAAATTKAQGQAANAGLKFGAILNGHGAEAQQAAADAVAALQDAAGELAKAGDPLAPLQPGADGEKPGAGSKKAEANQDKAAQAATPELAARTSAAVVQPMARQAGVTWSGTTNVRNELAESMAVQAGASYGADETELANWSQYLGSNATGLGNGIAAKQSAFMAQLRQNLQILPPHEQIAVQIRDAMQNGNSRLTVALHPAELGRVEVKLDIDKDKNVTATVIVDRPGTLDLLRNDAKALERALQDAGLQTGSGSLSFNLRDSNGQDGGAQNGSGTGRGASRGNGAGGSEVKAEVRADVVATADGYVDLET
jgi:flagellar hook-length control protein FliK